MSEDTYIQLCPLFCSQCNEKFNCNTEFNKHNADVHDLKEIHVKRKDYVCPLCKAGFRRRAHVKRHIITQHSNAKGCLPCGEEFSSFELLLTHLETKHIDPNEHTVENNDGIELDSKRKYHMCQLCKARFQRKEHLRRHISTLHSDIKNCMVCHETFTTLDALLKHLENMHSDVDEWGNGEIKLYKECQPVSHRCPHCKANFKRRDHMLRHIRCAHLPEKTVSCRMCKKSYKRTDHVIRHLREKHNISGSNMKALINMD